jgi:hypothetical protein
MSFFDRVSNLHFTLSLLLNSHENFQAQLDAFRESFGQVDREVMFREEGELEQLFKVEKFRKEWWDTVDRRRGRATDFFDKTSTDGSKEMLERCVQLEVVAWMKEEVSFFKHRQLLLLDAFSLFHGKTHEGEGVFASVLGEEEKEEKGDGKNKKAEKGKKKGEEEEEEEPDFDAPLHTVYPLLRSLNEEDVFAFFTELKEQEESGEEVEDKKGKKKGDKESENENPFDPDSAAAVLDPSSLLSKLFLKTKESFILPYSEENLVSPEQENEEEESHKLLLRLFSTLRKEAYLLEEKLVSIAHFGNKMVQDLATAAKDNEAELMRMIDDQEQRELGFGESIVKLFTQATFDHKIPSCDIELRWVPGTDSQTTKLVLDATKSIEPLPEPHPEPVLTTFSEKAMNEEQLEVLQAVCLPYLLPGSEQQDMRTVEAEVIVSSLPSDTMPAPLKESVLAWLSSQKETVPLEALISHCLE